MTRRSWTPRGTSPSLRGGARVVTLGRRLVYGVAESVSGSGRLLTQHPLTYARR